jgi:menaquinone-dependent protoporphyrinogen oxidase
MSKSILVCYATGEGQTAKVATHVADTLRATGHAPTVFDLDDAPRDLDVSTYDGVLLGASIHLGKHQDAMVEFARGNRETLDAMPSGFFEVCLSAASDDPERQTEARQYVDEFREATGWDPDLVGIFGGAFRYSEYGFIKRRLMKRIAADSTGDTDTSRDYEYTDWDAVTAFAEAFGALVDAGVEPDAGEVAP